MTEKEIEQKFKADFRGFFPKLKDATALLAAKNSSDSGRMVDIILRLRVGDKPKNLLCEVVSQSYPKQLREKGLQLLEKNQAG
jgi:hypothetical protein